MDIGKMRTDTNRLETVDRALRVLTAFPRDGREVGLVELSKAVGIQPSMVFRLLYTLRQQGFVLKDPASRKYTLGPRLFELGSVVALNLNLRRKALPVMQRLSETTGESVLLYAYSGGECVCVEGAEATHARVRYTVEVGARLRLHAGAGAKVLLAFRPKSEIEAYLRQPLPGYTRATITDPSALRTELEKIRVQGYAISHGELEVSVAAVAAPVRDHQGSVVAGLTLVGPEFRLPPKRTRALAGTVVNFASEISQALGHMETSNAVGSVRG